MGVSEAKNGMVPIGWDLSPYLWLKAWKRNSLVLMVNWNAASVFIQDLALTITPAGCTGAVDNLIYD